MSDLSTDTPLLLLLGDSYNGGMNKTIKRLSVWSICLFAIIFSTFVFAPNAKAAHSTGIEYVYFRIETELDTLNDKAVTVNFTCNSFVTVGNVTDGAASESTGIATTPDGVIRLASGSAELNNCDVDDTLRASVSIDGWVTRTFSTTIRASTSDGGNFTTRASQDYLFRVNGAQDELANAFTMASISSATNLFASSSYSVAPASSSYHAGVWYAATTANGTIYGGKDGFVRKSCAITWSDGFKTTSKSADFGLAATSDCDGDALEFGHKVQVHQYGNTFALGKLSTGTVDAGDSYGTSCTAGTGSNEGYWYCPVPISNTETLVKYTGATGAELATTTATYADRTTGSNAQVLSYIAPASTHNGGLGFEATPTPTPEASPTPTPEASPTPTPTFSPTPTPTPGTVKLFRKVSDPKVYVQAGDGTLTWVKTLEQFNAAGYKWSDVKLISGSEFAKFVVKGTLGVKKGVTLNIRKSASATSAILGKMKLNDAYEKIGQSGVWFKINFKGQDGWVHSGYTVDK